MAIVDTITSLYRYRENISDIIRAKGIDIPENTQLRYIPQYINGLIKPERAEVHPVFTQEFQDQCVADSLANYIHERSLWNGHVDAAGLREIGWTDDDIEYFQINGVDWNEDDDDKYLVSDYEKELYRTDAIRVIDKKVDGVTIKASYTSALINSNDPQVVEWRNTIRWVPKFTTDAMPTTISFRNFMNMIGCPYFDFSKTTNPSYLFSRCINLRCIPPIRFIDNNVNNWNGQYIFFECSKIKTIPTTINWERCSTLYYAFADCGSIEYLPEINIPNSTSLEQTFTNNKKLIGISQITTSEKLLKCNSCFAGCRALLTAPLFDTSKCTDMNNMFSNCQTLLNVPCYDTSSNTSFSTFFRNCSNILAIPNFNFQPIVTSYSGMFYGCEKLLEIPKNMDFTSCTNVSTMCYRCLAITDFPYKLNLNTSATTVSEGIKSSSQCLYMCTNLKKVSIGKYKTISSSNTFIDTCVFIEEINIDDFTDSVAIILSESNLFNVVKIGGELKGIRKGFNMSAMRKLPKEEIMHVINALEDITDAGAVQTLTLGAEALRNLTVEDKLIATNKGWKLN